ncbi:hypothetical protein VCR14J2_270002 [Vibrio coralliirubri]|nr:hypothetical protein VCR12J2_1010002 [Vibrio coralliirubri]CDT98970.1 hypothetical protein VCR14J2_270002 [Vibrio coralliirubri]
METIAEHEHKISTIIYTFMRQQEFQQNRCCYARQSFSAEPSDTKA